MSGCKDVCDIRASLLDCLDDILEVRDCIGAKLADCYIITRTWSGERPGDGTFTDVTEQILPTPNIKNLSHDVRVTEAGAYKSGDLILQSISKHMYPDEAKLLTTTKSKKVQKFIKVGKHYYTTIGIVEHLVTWDIQIRKVSQDETERS